MNDVAKVVVLSFIFNILVTSYPSMAYARNSDSRVDGTIYLGVKKPLSKAQVRQVEARIRKTFRLQSKEIDNNLLKIHEDLNLYLFGPGMDRRLTQYYNVALKAEDKTEDELWKDFQKNVLSRKEFLQTMDEMIEMLFRSAKKTEHAINRSFMGMDLEGMPAQDYSKEKKRLKTAIRKIWESDAGEMKKIVTDVKQNIQDMNRQRRTKEIGDLVIGFGGFAGAAKLYPILGPVYGTIVFVTVIAINIGWNYYQSSKVEHTESTSYQEFTNRMKGKLQDISEQTNREFEKSTKNFKAQIEKAFLGEIQKLYPQIKEVR